MSETQSRDPLVWIDCEMTGLDLEKDEIIEIACIVTDWNLQPIGPPGFEITIGQTHEKMASMNEWCIEHHGKSGLTAKVIASKISHQQAAEQLLAYVKARVPKARTALLAGNSVHADKAFFNAEPAYAEVMQHLHYRILDVSSIKEAVRRFSPQEVLAQIPKKKKAHTAMEDILESIAEMRYYSEQIFQKKSDTASR
ncbi:hypothetical protein FKW77_002441 [Venturia effusa]|uniref:Exonuclease domain-containing protein n=1 Tax=Venturia effusa TaxID=50376 RepID=A0A517LIB5_9PEZI|nr:hypothetical protein FKW77_002441 [Venturia effusa]